MIKILQTLSKSGDTTGGQTSKGGFHVAEHPAEKPPYVPAFSVHPACEQAIVGRLMQSGLVC